uniref:Uncharacterized protein n=1 Tax=Arundo donax TaxID=35708 RepID=A0A0A9ATQ8_ARUDO
MTNFQTAKNRENVDWCAVCTLKISWMVHSLISLETEVHA